MEVQNDEMKFGAGWGIVTVSDEWSQAVASGGNTVRYMERELFFLNSTVVVGGVDQ